MKRILQLIIVALVLINISLAATVSRVEIKEIDSTVKITLNTVTSYKLFFKDDKIRVLLKDTDLNLSQTEANLMPGGPVSKVSLYPEGNNSYVDIMLNYSAVNYKAYVSGNFTIIEVSEKNLPEPVGPKTAESSSKKVRNYIVLSASSESYTVTPSDGSTKSKTKSEVEVKKVEVSKKSTTKAQTSSKTQKSNTLSNQVSKNSSRNITLDLVDATLVDTVRLITENLGWNVIFSPEVIKYQEKLTMKLVNVEPEKALRMILLANGFDYKVVEGIAYVSTPDKLEKFQQDVKVAGPMKSQVINLENASAKEIEPIIKANFPEASVQVVEKTNSLLVKAPVKSIVEIKNLIGQLDVPPPPPPPMTPPITEVIRLNYAQARDVIQMMGNLVPKEAIVEDARMNSLIVTGTPDIIDTVKSFVKAVDVPMPQIAIRLHFLQVDEAAGRNLGVDWGNQSNNINLNEQGKGIPNNANPNLDPGLGVTWFLRNPLTFSATLNYLIESRKGRVLSAPYVMTQNRQ
ncbi:MAG: secretin N-terminal domain-containing protein, partial [Sulfurihydrogenibium azorense]